MACYNAVMPSKQKLASLKKKLNQPAKRTFPGATGPYRLLNQFGKQPQTAPKHQSSANIAPRAIRRIP